MAREALGVLDGQVAPEALEELRLLVSELVTNSLRHGRPCDDTVRLEVAVDGEQARVSVVDGGQGFTPPERPPDLADPGGWGLVVVDRLADRWGIENNGKTKVWLELGLAADRRPSNV